MSFKSSKYCKIYGYVSVDLQNPIVTAGNNASQRKTGYRFVIAAMRLILLIGIMYTLILILWINKTADDGAYAATDNVATFNGSHSIIQKINSVFYLNSTYTSRNSGKCLGQKQKFLFRP